MSRTRHHGDKAKHRRFGDNWRWMSNEPKWWRKLMNHRPARRRERAMLDRLEDANYPDHRKPHIYYW